MRNIELKARSADPAFARKIAQSLATNRLGIQHQIDTYFCCNYGRLKLREIDALRTELIWYARADQQGPAASVREPGDPAYARRAESRDDLFVMDDVAEHADGCARPRGSVGEPKRPPHAETEPGRPGDGDVHSQTKYGLRTFSSRSCLPLSRAGSPCSST